MYNKKTKEEQSIAPFEFLLTCLLQTMKKRANLGSLFFIMVYIPKNYKLVPYNFLYTKSYQ